MEREELTQQRPARRRPPGRWCAPPRSGWLPSELLAVDQPAARGGLPRRRPSRCWTSTDEAAATSTPTPRRLTGSRLLDGGHAAGRGREQTRDHRRGRARCGATTELDEAHRVDLGRYLCEQSARRAGAGADRRGSRAARRDGGRPGRRRDRWTESESVAALERRPRPRPGASSAPRAHDRERELISELQPARRAPPPADRARSPTSSRTRSGSSPATWSCWSSIPTSPSTATPSLRALDAQHLAASTSLVRRPAAADPDRRRPTHPWSGSGRPRAVLAEVTEDAACGPTSNG